MFSSTMLLYDKNHLLIQSFYNLFIQDTQWAVATFSLYKWKNSRSDSLIFWVTIELSVSTLFGLLKASKFVYE